MSASSFDLAIAIGGAAGQGLATPGDILARTFVRRGLHIYAYNAHQSIIRGGHILLTLRVGDRPVTSHGDKLDILVCLNQDTMDRHLGLMGRGSRVLFNSDAITPGEPAEGVQLCPIPAAELTSGNPNKLLQNTLSLGVMNHLLGIDFDVLESSLTQQFERKGEAVVDQNVSVARAGYDYSAAHFDALPTPAPSGGKPQAVWSGNDAFAMGGAAAGVKFYAAYPMSPATGILHWMARNARELGIMVRQMEDEIAVANMVIGAAHAGTRSMCATSGGGFALMTEAIGAASMMEIPCVFINVMRAGPSTGVPTKTEQGDLWQMLGASQGDFERLIVAPTNALDGFNTIPELFNLVDKYQCPGIVISDQLLSEGTYSVDPDDLDLMPGIDRGELITDGTASLESGQLPDPGTREGSGYLRYEDTGSGISARAIPGVPGHVHVVATDEHDEDGVLLSDEYTNPHKRAASVRKRARKIADVAADIEPPRLEGWDEAEVTLIGWGSTRGVIEEAVRQLAVAGVAANHLPIKWIVPLHTEMIAEVISNAKRTVIVENNYSGQFHRYLRSVSGLDVDAHIRKFDGEPFMPHHIVDGVKAILDEQTDVYVPEHEILV
jgi:2-oxoglutarate ferredoxin oxidoreductase subunit alpha